MRRVIRANPPLFGTTMIDLLCCAMGGYAALTIIVASEVGQAEEPLRPFVVFSSVDPVVVSRCSSDDSTDDRNSDDTFFELPLSGSECFEVSEGWFNLEGWASALNECRVKLRPPWVPTESRFGPRWIDSNTKARCGIDFTLQSSGPKAAYDCDAPADPSSVHDLRDALVSARILTDSVAVNDPTLWCSSIAGQKSITTTLQDLVRVSANVVSKRGLTAFPYVPRRFHISMDATGGVRLRP